MRLARTRTQVDFAVISAVLSRCYDVWLRTLEPFLLSDSMQVPASQSTDHAAATLLSKTCHEQHWASLTMQKISPGPALPVTPMARNSEAVMDTDVHMLRIVVKTPSRSSCRPHHHHRTKSCCFESNASSPSRSNFKVSECRIETGR